MRGVSRAGVCGCGKQGDDVCAVENELSLEARKAAAVRDGSVREGEVHRIGEGENFQVPVVLMTLGWDPAGDPTHHERLLGRDTTCTRRMLELPRVVRWFTSHTRHDSHTDEKVRDRESSPVSWCLARFGGNRRGVSCRLSTVSSESETTLGCHEGSAGQDV